VLVAVSYPAAGAERRRSPHDACRDGVTATAGRTGLWCPERSIGVVGGRRQASADLDASAGKGSRRGKTMKTYVSYVRALLVSEDAPTAVEYAVMLALVIAVALVAITLLGQKVSMTFQNAESVLPDGT
jgi:pilus assembly protein Flp/PilA